MSRTTRTLNPLPFGDLEPKRFEDLVRQLVYDFRPWRSIEPTGRLGNDGGIDIRAVEAETAGAASEDGEDPTPPATAERLWIFQCKREKKLGPKGVRTIVSDGLVSLTDLPYGFVIAAACDFSSEARIAFRDELAKRGIREGHIWGKADLEDMLFLPKNDRLLFAYFYISLQVKRQTMRTEIRSRIAQKRALGKALAPVAEKANLPVLLRDPTVEGYPFERKEPQAGDWPAWGYVRFVGHDPPDHLAFEASTFFGYVDDQYEKWDAAFVYREDRMTPHPYGGLAGAANTASDQLRERVESFWREKVPEKNRVLITEIRFVHYDRVLAIDELGDTRNPGPHLHVEYNSTDGPFEPQVCFHRADWVGGLYGPEVSLDDANRLAFFPEDMRGSLNAPPRIIDSFAQGSPRGVKQLIPGDGRHGSGLLPGA